MKFKYNNQWLPITVPISLGTITVQDNMVLEQGNTMVQKEISYPDGFNYSNSKVIACTYGFTDGRDSRTSSENIAVSESNNNKIMVTYNKGSAAESDTTIYIELVLLNTNVPNDFNNPIYSTDEVKTNMTWIDGKPIYRKVFEISALPAFSDQEYSPDPYEISTGVSNIAESISINGVIRKAQVQTGNATFSVNCAFPGGVNTNNLFTYYSNTDNKVKIYYGDAFIGSTGYVVLEYTKTTD